MAENGDWIAVMRPSVASKIELMAIGAGFNVADATLKNGYAGSFMGFHCYVSNNMTANHAYIGKRGGIHCVVQQDVKMKINSSLKGQIGTEFIASVVYGHTVFVQDALRFLDVQITS